MFEDLAKVAAAIAMGVGVTQLPNRFEVESDMAAAFTAPYELSSDDVAQLMRSPAVPNQVFPIQQLPDTGWYPKGPIANHKQYIPTTLAKDEPRYIVEKRQGGPVAKKVEPAPRRPASKKRAVVRKPVPKPVRESPPVIHAAPIEVRPPVQYLVDPQLQFVGPQYGSGAFCPPGQS